MTQEQINEAKKVVAAFMGIELIEGAFPMFDPVAQTGIRGDINYLLYNTDWNHLMPVVQKIESLQGGSFCSIKIESNICRAYYNGRLINCISILNKTKIQMVFECVVDFIKWYKKEK
jgi:hypothetical protein